MDNENNTLKQDLAVISSQYPHAVLKLIQYSMVKNPLVGDNEFSTIVNAVTLEAQSNLLIGVTKLMEDIKNGSLFNAQ